MNKPRQGADLLSTLKLLMKIHVNFYFASPPETLYYEVIKFLPLICALIQKEARVKPAYSEETL